MFYNHLISIFLFLIGFCSIVSAQSQSQTKPVVNITLPQNADMEFQNGTVLTMTNSHLSFELQCTAPYPIQWLSYFEPEDEGNSANEKWAETRRYVQDFNDPSTYGYSAIFSLSYTGKLHVFTNFSCQSTQNWKIQTNVIMTGINLKNVVILTTIGSVLLPEQPEPEIDKKILSSGGGLVRGNDSCAIYAVVSQVDEEQSCWKCETKQGTDLELDFYGCETGIDCNSYYQKRINTKCLRIIPKDTENPGCKLSEVDYNPKIVACKNNGVALVQFYYFSIVRREDGSPFMYFAWNQIEPEKMLKLYSIPKEVFVGDSLTLVCELSKFYFSYGIWFGLLDRNGVMEYIECIEPPSRIETGDDSYVGNGDFKRNITIEVTSELRKIFCFGPVWNSERWINASLNVSVNTEGHAPLILEPKNDSEVSFALGAQNQVLKCKIAGKPFPNVEWSGPVSSHFTTKEANSNEMWSQITIPEMTHASAGKYVCTAKSFKGVAKRTFTLSVSDSYKSTLVISALVLIPIALIILLIIILGWKKIKQQRKELRLLTDTEVREFVEGNSKLIKSHEYFDGAIAIDALPFDQKKFEIPFDHLQIDYAHLLGSGAFGEVYKGQVKKIGGGGSVMNEYANTTTPTNSTLTFVAIKTVRRDVDVETFKALLSEIKIMAFLEGHKNIVSLIGATTENIRNRQAWIVVEFCGKGSLDNYLKKNRSAFINHVQYGVLNTDATLSPGLGEYQNVRGECVSTFDLLKWAYDIANGMEYLDQKKVIHGDIALRNILLSSEATAKIGDFGLSRQLINTSNYFKKTHCPLPWKWMAPESLNELRFSIHSDIWSYGVTLWELFSLSDVPYKGYSYNQEFLTSIRKGYRLDKPQCATNSLYEYMIKCWNLIPENRPRLDEIKGLCADALKDIVPQGYFRMGPTTESTPMSNSSTPSSVDQSEINRISKNDDGYEIPVEKKI